MAAQFPHDVVERPQPKLGKSQQIFMGVLNKVANRNNPGIPETVCRADRQLEIIYR